MIRSTAVDPTDQVKSIALVSLGDVEVEVPYWYSSLTAYGLEGLRQLLLAEALWMTNRQQEARAVLEADADGVVVFDPVSRYADDQRNWQQRWLDDHLVAPVVADPFA